MRIPDWLVDRANDGIFPLNLADLGNELSEILGDRDADSIVDNDSRNRCCTLLRARQRDIEYLSSLDLHKVIAKYVRASCRRAQAADETIESWVNLDPASAALIALAEEIEYAIRAAWKVRTPSDKGESKFTDELLLDRIDKFHHGLEHQIGYPPTHADFLDLMKREHDQMPFVGRNRTVDPKLEWNIVMQSDVWNFSGVDCKPTIVITGRACTTPLKSFVKTAQEKFEEANAIDDVLNEAEIAALRLWTGPMHEKYAEALRNPQNANGPYVTTLHAINSGITKLAKIWPLPVNRKVYRGYKNLRLQGLKKDAFNCVGGVERCVLATSEDFNVAVDYSEDGAFILEIEVGQANRGADVSWLSQFPHEREILFNALSNVEFVCSPQQRIVNCKDKRTRDRTPGKLLVYQVRVSANLRSKTLQEFIGLRKDLHLNLVDVLAQEATLKISMRAACSDQGLIKRLCAKCTKQCDAIRNNTKKADVKIFNEGTEQYVGLVKDAIMFKSRSETIIDLALRWFKHGKADPAEVGVLLGWQLQALRDAFKDSEVPLVTTVVLEQDRNVGSLFGGESLRLGAFHKVDTVCNVAKMLSLNPKLESLDMDVASATWWESVFSELCPGRPSLRVNGFHLAEYATISTLQQLELRNRGDRMAAMIPPALLIHPPSALTYLSLCGTSIACAGAESLGRAFTGLQLLKCLDLRSCEIADRGCTGIAQKLSALSELEDLNLAYNNVDDDGFNYLASTIRVHGLSRLQSVDMRFNTTQLPSLRRSESLLIRNHIVSKLWARADVLCLAWRPGGDHIASGSANNEIIIWDAKTGGQLSTLKGHTGWVRGVAWNPDGTQIASASDDETMIIWDAKTGSQVSILEGHTGNVMSVAWCPGGDQIASGSFNNTIITWDAKTGEQISTLKGHTAGVMSVAWCPEGGRITSASNDCTIIVWDARTGEQISTFTGHTHFVDSVGWRPGGDQIASGSWDNSIIIWDVKTGKKVLTLEGHTSAVICVDWCPGGDQIASGSADFTIIIWDVTTGDQVSTLKGHTKRVTSVAWRPGGDQIASASYDEQIIIRDVKIDDQVSTLKGHTNAVMSVAWRPGGDQIASASNDNTIIIWEPKTGDQISTFKGHSSWVESVAWSPGGDQIASGLFDKTIIIWDAKTGDQVFTLKGHTLYVTCVAWRPGGDQIASASNDNTIIIWDAKTGEQGSTLKGHARKVTSVAWHPGGDQIASGSSDKTIIIWDAKTGDQVSMLKGHSDSVYSVAWRPWGDQIASGSRDNTIIIWDTKTGEQVSTLKGHTHWVKSVAWSPGGNQIASGSRDGTIIIWDAKTGDQVSTLQGHTSYVTSVAWRPGGDQIASASHDSLIIIWVVKTGKQVCTLKEHTSSDEVQGVARSPSTIRVGSATSAAISATSEEHAADTGEGSIPQAAKKQKTH